MSYHLIYTDKWMPISIRLKEVNMGENRLKG